MLYTIYLIKSLIWSLLLIVSVITIIGLGTLVLELFKDKSESDDPEPR